MKKLSFTLIELLVTIAIVIILAGILIGGMSFASGKADNARTRATLQQLASALEEFRSKNGFYPPCGDGVSFKLRIGDGNKLVMKIGSGGSATEWTLGKNPDFAHLTTSDSDLNDAWDKSFQYKCPGNKNKGAYDLWSCGKDGTSGTEDDITNWDSYN